LERGSDGSYLAWVDELPGCFVRGASRDEVLVGAPAAIRDFLAWAGEPVPEVIETRVTEEVASAIETDEDTEALVALDRRPLGRSDWDRMEEWLERYREELMDLLRGLGDDALESRREGSERTIREEIEHVAFVELMYLVWTFDLRSREGLAAFLAWTRGLAVERMRDLAREGAAEVTWAEWAGAPRPEEWTPQKAARRLLWHELLHLRAIESARGSLRR